MLLTGTEVLEMIEPADPDNLQFFNDRWVAKWAPPILGGDIEALKHTPGITITRNEYEPEGLPGWAAIDFTVGEESSRSEPF